MAEAPLISVVVPTFNLAEFLPRTLDSILAQAYRPVEIVVIDGGSRDGTVDILRDYSQRHEEVRWISEPDDGPADAVNKGFNLARGDIGAIQSADDVYYPGVFDEVMEIFRAQPGVGMVYGHADAIDVDDHVLTTAQYPDFSWEAIFAIGVALPQSSVFFRMGVVREMGGWNAAYYSADLDFWFRMLLRTRPIRLDKVLSAWRVRPEQRTRPEQYQALWDGYWRMIEDCEELKAAPRRVRRLAYASRHLFALQFHPTGNIWAQRWHVLRALPGHPTFWRYYPPGRIKRLAPGFSRAQRSVRRLRRALATRRG
jgi:glycosyltransferase involved in cell wall biosynthesis